MKYKKIMLFLTFSLSLSLSGCGNGKVVKESERNANLAANRKDSESIISENAANEKETNMIETADTVKPVDFPETYQKEINGVTFDMAVCAPADLDFDGLFRSTVTKQNPDNEKTISALAADKTIKEERYDTGSGEDGAFDIYDYEFDDDAGLYIDTNLTYYTDFSVSVHRAFKVWQNADQYTTQTFDFQTPENAFADIVNTLNESGYEIGDTDYLYYSLDAETLAQEEVVTDKDGEVIEGAGREWTGEDDCYAFFASQVYEGLPVYFGYQEFPEDSAENRVIQALYSARGIEDLRATKIYSFTPSQEKIQLKEFDAIAQTVADKYGNILSGEHYKVTRAKLYQVPVKDVSGSYELKVAWLFEIHAQGTDSATGESYDFTQINFIDAETGEEIFI